jgi:2-polyprenyl-6-methoxyphenol hydroxylase-like FAD-dependent oxidoreductase
MSSAEYDAIVIGGGPAGSTSSALLAEYGHKVLLLEREPFPRYHIGESLIPYTWFTLNRLGVLDWLRKSACPKKYSVQFVSITGKVSQPFYFFKTMSARRPGRCGAANSTRCCSTTRGPRASKYGST